MKVISDIPADLCGVIWHYRNTGEIHQMHSHRELQVNLVVRGQATYLMSDRRYDLRPRTQLWIFPDQDHVLVNKSDDFEMWIVLFCPEMVKRVATMEQARILREPNPVGQFSRQLSSENMASLATLFGEVAASTKRDPGCFNVGLPYAMLRAWTVHLNTEELTGGQELHPAVETAARLIRDEPEPLNIEQLADRCGLSPCQLSRVFKQQAGVTLVTYRQRACLERFLKLYGQGRRTSMLRAALKAGFGSYPQFHRVFRRLMGRSPAAYRREINGEPARE